MTTPALPAHEGRPTRVTLLVYNDAHADSRVLKTAASLRRAGAQVCILAVARTHLGYPATTEMLPDGVELIRLPEPAFISYVPRLKRAFTRLRTRFSRKPFRAAQVADGPPLQVADSSIPAAATPSPTPHRAHQVADSPSRQVADSSIPATSPPAASVLNSVLVRLRDPLDRLARTLILAHYWAKAIGEGSRRRPDVVHANDGNTLLPGRAIARRTGARLIYDSHELWRHRNVRNRPVGKHVEALIERRITPRADGVITVSPSIARWLQRAYRLPVAPTLVRNIPSAGEPADPATGRLRELAGLAATDQVIAYGGRITTSRGLEETIAALALLPGHVHLVVLGYGDPGYLTTLRRRAAQHGVEARVHFVGKVAPAEVAPTLADADLSVVYVRPTCLSYEYSLPNKLFEAIHAGIPVAAADLPDTKQIVTGYGVGEIFGLVREDDSGPPAGTEAAAAAEATAMARTIIRVLEQPEAYRQAARGAAKELTWEHEERRLIELYHRVLTRPAPPRKGPPVDSPA